MANFDTLQPNTDAFIDVDNNIYELQQVLESGAVVVTAATPGTVTPIGTATTPKFENIAPWCGAFINSSNAIIDLLQYLQSGAIQVQVVGGGGGGAPTTATYITKTDQTLVLPNSVPLSGLATGLLANTTGTGALTPVTLTGTANQLIVTGGDGSSTPTFSIAPTLVLPGTLTLGGVMDTLGNTIQSSVNTLVLANVQAVDINSPWLSVNGVRHLGEATNKILFGTQIIQLLPDNFRQFEANANGVRLLSGPSVNAISTDGTFASPNNNSLATTQAIYTFVTSLLATSFVTVTTATQSLAANTTYYSTYAGTCVMSLPTTILAGQYIKVRTDSAGDAIKITQSAGQQVFYGANSGVSVQTTLGASGYLLTLNPNTTLWLECIVDNTTFMVVSNVNDCLVV